MKSLRLGKGFTTFSLHERGFTLIELLIVIAVIGVLSAGVLTALNVTASLNKANLAKAKTFSASIENGLAINQVGKWSFEEGAGTTAKDTSGYGNDGTLTGASLPVWQDQTQCGLGFGGCLQFGGSGYISILDSSNWILGSNFTLHVWAYFDDITGTRAFLSQHDNDNINFNMILDGGVLQFKSNSSNPDVSIAVTLSTSTWYNIVFVNKNGTGQFYLNGVSMGTPAAVTPVGDINRPLFIGASQEGGPGYFLRGKMDEAAVYKEALSAYQIHELYAQALPRHQFVYLR